MKILRVKGKNLASIAGEFEIDFTREPLYSAGIFAISGPTGSGKSTLLDAICLALYNNTPRTTGIENTKVPDTGKELIQQGDKRQILRRGSTEAYASVEFIAIDGKIYLSLWKVRRANNKANGKLQPVEFLLYEKGNPNPITEKITETENKLVLLTGLNFNQFTRTVLLAQNEFARFLKARKEEKAEVLEKLTGTEIYSRISNVIYTKTNTLRTAWKEIHRQLDHLPLLSEKELEHLRGQIKNLTEKETELQTERETLKKQITWTEQLKILHTSRQEALEHLQQSEKAIGDFMPQTQWLRQIEQVENCRSLWQEKNELSRSLFQQTFQLKQCTEKKDVLTKEVQQIEESFVKQKKLIAYYSSEYELLQPQLIQARRLDLELKHTGKTLLENEATLNTLLKDKTEAKKQQNKRATSLESVKQKITQLQLWFEKNKQHEQMCLNMNIIQSLFESIHSSQEQINKYTALRLENQKKKQNSEQLFRSLSSQYESIQAKLSEASRQRQTLQQQIKQIPIALLREKRETLRRQKEILTQARFNGEQLSQIRQELQQYQLKRKEKKEQQEKLIQNYTSNQIILKEAETKYHILRQSYEKARCVASEYVTELRTGLEDGVPCPVCGSCDHPYAKDKNPALSVLNTIKKDFDLAEKEYNTYKSQAIEIQSELKYLKENLLTLNQEYNLKQAECEEILTTWRKRASELHFLRFITPEHIRQAEIKWSEEIQHILSQENEWEKLNNQLYDLNRLIEQFHSQAENKQKEIQEMTREKNQPDLEISKINGMLEKLHGEQQKASDQIGTYLQVENWEKRWKEAPSRFRQELLTISEQWQYKSKEIQTLTKHQDQLLAEEKEAGKNLSLLARNEKELRKENEKKRQQFEQFQRERQALLQGKPVEETERQYRLLLHENNKKLEEISIKKDSISGELQKLIGEELQLTHSIRKQKINAENTGARLTDWLKQYNRTADPFLTEEALADLLTVSPDEIQHFRELQKQLQEDHTIASTTFQERDFQLKKHRETAAVPFLPDSPEVLEARYSELQQKGEELLQQKTSLLAQLHLHNENCRRADSLRKQLEEQAAYLNQWSKLDELIGSQSGYKFKEIAQGYTLDLLVAYANRQLQELTPRYRLQRVPDELALQVIDHDFCDETRSVFSLSGGESFIVSLALALGLSSFSARNHYEENLFIDEGFGSLDAETLQVVMEALERLRSRGRQVGIISHVRELTERIPARINLKKAGNGKSKVEIWPE